MLPLATHAGSCIEGTLVGYGLAWGTWPIAAGAP